MNVVYFNVILYNQFIFHTESKLYSLKTLSIEMYFLRNLLT